MKKINVVNEFDLLNFARCPLYLARNDHSPEPADTVAVNAAADDLLHWITWETFEHNVPDLSEVRGRADAFFRRQYNGPMTSPLARRLVRISRRLHDLVFFNDVLYPSSSYQLDFGVAQIEGTATVVKSKSKISLPPRIIRLRNHAIKPLIIPDLVSVARWLYGFRESGYPRCVVGNYSLAGDTTSSQDFSEAAAQKWLATAVQNWVEKKVYPSLGHHCKGCQKPCLSLS
jgi:hypothetical protein